LEGGISIEHTNDQGLLSINSICYCQSCWDRYLESGTHNCPHCRQSLGSPAIVVRPLDCGRQRVPLHFEDGRVVPVTSAHTGRDVLHALAASVYTRLSYQGLILVDLDRLLVDVGVLEDRHAQMKLVDLHKLLVRVMQSGKRELFLQILGYMEPEMAPSVRRQIERLVFDVVGIQLHSISIPAGMHSHRRNIAFVTTLGYVIRLRIDINAESPSVLIGIDAGLRNHRLVTLEQFERPFFGLDPDEVLLNLTDLEETRVRHLYTPMVMEDWHTTDLFQRVLTISAHAALYMEIDYRRHPGLS